MARETPVRRSRRPAQARRIRRDVPIAYHYQLRELLRAAILRKDYAPETRFPSEHELCRTYQVSRTTVRQALQALVREGLLYPVRGRGTFVTQTKILEGLATNLSFYDDMRARGIPVTTRVLTYEIEPAPASVAMPLGIRPGDNVFKVERLRSVGRSPLLTVTSYLPADICPGLEAAKLTTRGLHQILREDCGIVPARAVRSFEALPATPEDARLLKIPAGAPVQHIESVVYDEAGVPIEFFIARHRGDRTKFQFEIVQRAAPKATAGGRSAGGRR